MSTTEAKRAEYLAYQRAYYARRKQDDPAWQERNRKRCREGYKRWPSAKRKRVKRPGAAGRYSARRRATDICYREKTNMGNLIRSALKRKGLRKTYRTLSLLGCTAPQFIRHIERQFKKGMSWDNRPRWHIDHIRPCASFDLSDPEQQKICFHYSNLRPIWKSENMRKHARQEFLI